MSSNKNKSNPFRARTLILAIKKNQFSKMEVAASCTSSLGETMIVGLPLLDSALFDKHPKNRTGKGLTDRSH
jgi:hypothetical protein